MRKGIIISDLTGAEIPEGEEVVSLAVMFPGASSNDYYLLDMTAQEAADLKTRGRPITKKAWSSGRQSLNTVKGRVTTQSFSLPPELLDDLRVLSRERGTSLSEEVREALKRHTKGRV